MNKKLIPFLLVILLLIGVMGFFAIRRNADIKQNPEGTLGNTAGNLNNGGYFCETADAIYFANPYDEGTLYKMNPDFTDIKKLSDAAIGYINSAGNYLYYYQKNSSAASSLGFVVHVSGLYRSDLTGNHVLCLDKSDCDRVNLIGNKVYYTKAVDGQMTLCLHSITTSKKDPKMLTDYLLKPSSSDGERLYYNGTERDHFLYSYDLATDNSQLLSQGSFWFPVYYGGSVYYLDPSADYSLCRLDLADGHTTVISDQRVDCFNLSEGYIYYQVNSQDDPGLYMSRIDGSQRQLVSPGVYTNINIAGGYVFFQNFKTAMPQYMCPLGSVAVSTFDDAKAVAMKNLK
jgi:hypothetical protein